MKRVLAAAITVFLAFSGCLAAQSPGGDHDPSTSPAGDDNPSTSPAESDPPLHETDDEEEPYLSNTTLETQRTAISLGVYSIHSSHFEPYETNVCPEEAPDAVRAVVEWEAFHPDADMEFTYLYPSGPGIVRGPSPLVWEHTLSDEDKEECAELWLEADSTDVNVLLRQEVKVHLTYAFNGAQLP